MKTIGRSSYNSSGQSGTPLAQLSICAILFILCLVTYHGTGDNFFFNDDFLWLQDAAHTMTLSNLWSHRVIDFFRPLVNLTFYLSERISPGDILFYNWTNLLLHFLNAVLVYVLLTALLRDRLVAAVAGILFAVTCVHTGAVFWVSARTTLLSTCLLLGALVLLTRPRFGVIGPLVLYILALAAKETAAVGCLLVLLIYSVAGNDRRRAVGRGDVAAFMFVTLLYFVLRLLLMGRFFQENWSLGPHLLRNLGGGFLYQLYPWPLFSFVFRSAGHFAAPQQLLWPEVLALPLVALLVWLGWRMRKRRSMLLAVGWSLIALLPSSLFTYRFFSTESMTQNRYYYLSSVGSVLIITLLLAMVWRTRNRVRKATAVALFIIVCAGYMIRVDALEKRWDAFTHNYQRVISIVLDEVRRAPEASTLAIEDAPMEFRYLEGALGYLHPEWNVHVAEDGRESARQWAPCLYIHFELEPGMLNVSSTMVE